MSDPYEEIRNKQVRWAQNCGLKLTGSKDERGYPAYTQTLEENLFEPLLPAVRDNFSLGDGGEINDEPASPAKMRAVHSTAALAVNVFQYWQRIQEAHVIAAACGFCTKEDQFAERIVFEEKFPILASSRRHPNLDVVIYNSEQAEQSVFAIECKFTEPFRGQKGLNTKYMQLRDWEDISNIHSLAEQLNPKFLHLDAAQLIRHVLGLKQKFGKNGFKLLYLYYDVSGPDGMQHKNEIDKFTRIAQSDNISFHSLTYQELIAGFASIHSEHSLYVDYLTERYL